MCDGTASIAKPMPPVLAQAAPPTANPAKGRPASHNREDIMDTAVDATTKEWAHVPRMLGAPKMQVYPTGKTECGGLHRCGHRYL